MNNQMDRLRAELRTETTREGIERLHAELRREDARIQVINARADVRREVDRRGLTSYMNETKWSELCGAVKSELAFPPAFQMKDMLVDQPFPESFESDEGHIGDWGEPFHFSFSIEWIRVRPRYLLHIGRLVAPILESCEEAFIAILERFGITYTSRDDSIWIYGYAASGDWQFERPHARRLDGPIPAVRS